jgi:Domain of unknown function (DUF5597)/Beta-galactosidase
MISARTLLASTAPLALAALAAAAPSPGLPHLERRGAATQLIVDGRPYLVLGGELENTASSSPAYLAPVWPRLARMHLNTVLAGVSWALLEPEEGKFDFSEVDDLLAGARRHQLRLILLWFGSWKNGLSSFAPAWVKEDQARFPRVRVRGGQPLEVLSPFGAATCSADARAYAALLRHLRETDSTDHTVIMIQLENEVGVLGDSRDRSAAADAAFARPVPAALLRYLASRRDHLRPELRRAWEDAGARTAGTWEQVFGPGAATDQRFMAWAYARYMDRVAAAGKAEDPLPVYTNTWIVQPQDNGPGDYPSGGPEPRVLDLWRAGAPHIDLNAPDIYLPDFAAWCRRFHRDGNPLFVPESRGDARGMANAFYAIGEESAIGYSPFGIDDLGRRQVLRPDPDRPPPPARIADLPITRAYAVLGQLAPLILRAQSEGAVAAASLTPGHPDAEARLGGYDVRIGLRRDFRNPAQLPPFGYGLVIATGPDRFVAAGDDVQVTFRPDTPGPPIAGLARVEAGTYVDGRWVRGRILNGDDVVLDYHLAAEAAVDQSGSGLRFAGEDGPTIQRVTLYRYGP